MENTTIDIWYPLATIVLAVVSIGIAIYSSRTTSKEAARQIEEIRNSTKEQVEALRNIVQYEGHIEWGHLEYYRMVNEFELKCDENELAFINEQIENNKPASKKKIKELEARANLLSVQVKNRNILLERYHTLFEYLDRTTMSILFDVDIFEHDEIKTCHKVADFPPKS